MQTNVIQEVQRVVTDRIKSGVSQNKLAKTLGVSAPIITYVLNSPDNVSEVMWVKLQAKLGVKSSSWNQANTDAWLELNDKMYDAQSMQLSFLLYGNASVGKSFAFSRYAQSHPNVIHLECEDYWNKKDFYKYFLIAMGESYEGLKSSDMVIKIIEVLRSKTSPLVILDQTDKLGHKISLYITLYNKLKDQCGFIIAGVPALKKDIERYAARDARHYKEIISRGGAKFIEIPKPSARDIALICKANGVDNQEEVSSIITQASNDLRRVEKLIKKFHVEQKQFAL